VRIFTGLLGLDANQVQEMEAQLDTFVVGPSAPKRFFGVSINEILNQLELDDTKYNSLKEAVVSIESDGGVLPATIMARQKILSEIQKRLVKK
jgi:hypothetical protein